MQLRDSVRLGLLTVLVASSLQAAADDKKDTMGAPPPKGAAVLFQDKPLDNWTARSGKAAGWKVADGVMEVVPRSGDVMTREKFGPDFQLHVEFWLPLMKDAKGQARANSGVYLQGRYEIQVLDSYMNETYPDGACGAMYKILTPTKNASKPPEQWQTFDITFRAPRVDDAGTITSKGQVTVIHNGETIIKDGEFDKVTGGALDSKIGTPGPILLQDHGNKIRFRNIWLLPLDSK